MLVPMHLGHIAVAPADCDCESYRAAPKAAAAHLRVLWCYAIEKRVSSDSPGGRGRRRRFNWPSKWPGRLSLPTCRVLGQGNQI